MKKVIYLFALVTLCLHSSVQAEISHSPAYASAPAALKPSPVPAKKSSSVQPVLQTDVTEASKQIPEDSTVAFTDPTEQKTTKKILTRSGWPGIVGFICGLCGLSVLAIIFSIIGLAPDRQFKGFALVGLILGIIGLIATVVWLA